MADELAQLIRTRRGHRSSTTKTVTKVNDLISARSIDETKLLHNKRMLEEKLDQLKALDNDIVKLTGEGDLEAEIQQADDYKSEIFAAIVKIERALKPPSATPPIEDPASAPTPGMARVQVTNVKLPKLSIKPFGGEITQWISFWDSFKSSIHDNTTLSEIDKFNYLRSFLERSAREAIAGLTLTGPNYNEAVSILEKRFGNKQQIISRHMELLLNLEPVTASYQLRNLRRLYDSVETHVRSLRSLGVDSATYGTLLSPVLLSKLPQELRLIVSRQASNVDLDKLLEEMEKEIDARERAQATQIPSHQPVRKPREPPHSQVLFSGNSSTSCCYCRKPHLSEACTTIQGLEDRKLALRKSGLCFVCLRRGHISRNCRSKLGCSHCGGRHHVSVCTRDTPAEPPGKVPDIENRPSSGSKTSTTTHTALNPDATPFSSHSTLYVGSSRSTLLQTAQVILYNPDNKKSMLRVRAVLDTGSQRSYASDAVKEALSLKPKEKQQLSIAAFGTTLKEPREYGVIQVGLRLKNSETQELPLITVPSICEPLTAQSISSCLETFKHLERLDLADHSNGQESLQVDVLIGADYYWRLVTGRTERCEGGLVAVETRLGWVLSGPVPREKRHKTTSSLLATHTLHVSTTIHETQTLNDTLQSFWELESLGTKQPEPCLLTEFENTITRKNGRYHVTLPWKKDHPPLPDNLQLARGRLHGLHHRLRQRPSLLKEYDAIIQDQIKQGVVEVVTQPPPPDRTVHYLPHHAVVRQDKATTKVRIVYDASAKSNGPSLNDCLYTGPKFDQKIMDILLRVRTSRIALTADIERAFLQIGIDERDQDSLRFLWYDDVTKPEPKIRTLKFTRVVFGLSSSPFLLNATVRHHLNKYTSTHPDLVKRISESMYVDDIVSGADTMDDAVKMFRESKALLKEGGFNLRKFNTNSAELRELILKEENCVHPSPTSKSHTYESYTKTMLGGSSTAVPGEQKTLGVKWCLETDDLILDVIEIGQQAKRLSPTKRHIVSLVGRIFDPLGFLSPVVVQLKLFFRELCEAKLEWDEPLTSSLLVKWESIVDDLQSDHRIHISRYLLDDVSLTVDSFSLTGFCDASEKAHAAVVYIRAKTQKGFHVRFLTSKTRVNPLQPQTIPRLELMSALLLTRLLVSVKNALESRLLLSETICYTDSKVALHWIKGADKEWKQFVQNRTTEIKTLLPDASWNHCPGKDNPADLPSRGVPFKQLISSDLWKKGPEWLTTERTEDEAKAETMPEGCIPELKAKIGKPLHNLVVVEVTTTIGQLITCESYSSAGRLFRVTAYVLLAVKKFKGKYKELKTLTAPLLKEAEILWIKDVQVHLIKQPQFNGWKKQLSLFVDPQGIWRCGGRLSNAEVPYTTRHPIILPRDHLLVKMLVLRAHARVYHDGVSETLNEVRASYWIVKGRSLVKRILRKCVTCRRLEGKAYPSPPPPPLPEFRVKVDSPFSTTGVDFAGPMYAKGPSSSKSTKVWICLYTCCITRAVHLDLVQDMTAPSFIRSLKRFASRRGLPRMFISDNGKTFKKAAKIIRAVVKSREVQDHLSGLGVKWNFNVEKAPWWGGIFERMVRSTKRCLKKSIGRAKLTYDELITSLTEIEAVINSDLSPTFLQMICRNHSPRRTY